MSTEQEDRQAVSKLWIDEMQTLPPDIRLKIDQATREVKGYLRDATEQEKRLILTCALIDLTA